MDLSKLTVGGKVIAVAAVVLFVSLFLPWFSFSAGGPFGSVDATGWDVGFLFSVLPMLLGLLMAAAVVVPAVKPDAKLPEVPGGLPNVILGAGVVAAVFVVLKVLIGEEFFTRSFGLFLAAVAAVALAVGGYLNMKAVNAAVVAGPEVAGPEAGLEAE